MTQSIHWQWRPAFVFSNQHLAERCKSKWCTRRLATNHWRLQALSALALGFAGWHGQPPYQPLACAAMTQLPRVLVLMCMVHVFVVVVLLLEKCVFSGVCCYSMLAAPPFCP